MFSRLFSNIVFSAKSCLNLNVNATKCVQNSKNLSTGIGVAKNSLLRTTCNASNILRKFCYMVMTPTNYDYKRQVTLNDLHRRGPVKKRTRKHPLDYKPLMKGIVIRTLVKHPKKPNSANRKCVLLKLSNGKEMIAYIPGEGHNLQEHSAVLVEKHRTKDVPGLKIRVVRGKLDCAHVAKKQSA